MTLFKKAAAKALPDELTIRGIVKAILGETCYQTAEGRGEARAIEKIIFSAMCSGELPYKETIHWEKPREIFFGFAKNEWGYATNERVYNSPKEREVRRRTIHIKDFADWLTINGEELPDCPLQHGINRLTDRKQEAEPETNPADNINTRRTNDFQSWIDEAKPDLNAMTWPQIYEALKSRNSKLWFSESTFDTWKKKQQIHKKGQNGRPPKPR